MISSRQRSVADACLWASMAALLFAAVLLRGLDLPSRPLSTGAFWPAYREGWRVLRANRPPWHVAWIIVATNGSAGVVEVLFLFRARDQLQFSPALSGMTGSLFKLGMPLALVVSGQLAAQQSLTALLALCAGVHLIAAVGVRCSAMYSVR